MSDLRQLERQASILKQLARAVVSLEDVARDGILLGFSEKEMQLIRKSYRNLNKLLDKIEKTGLEGELLRQGLLNE
jgi:CTP-dependent riboflavin kinase